MLLLLLLFMSSLAGCSAGISFPESVGMFQKFQLNSPSVIHRMLVNSWFFFFFRVVKTTTAVIDFSTIKQFIHGVLRRSSLADWPSVNKVKSNSVNQGLVTITFWQQSGAISVQNGRIDLIKCATTAAGLMKRPWQANGNVKRKVVR